MTPYQEKKSGLQFMIRHYSNNCLGYLARTDLTLDDLETLWEYDEAIVDRYNQELALLEANKILQLI